MKYTRDYFDIETGFLVGALNLGMHYNSPVNVFVGIGCFLAVAANIYFYGYQWINPFPRWFK